MSQQRLGIKVFLISVGLKEPVKKKIIRPSIYQNNNNNNSLVNFSNLKNQIINRILIYVKFFYKVYIYFNNKNYKHGSNSVSIRFSEVYSFIIWLVGKWLQMNRAKL